MSEPKTEPNPEEARFVPNADAISLETVVNVLVKKGVCTFDELYKEESELRLFRQEAQRQEYLRVKSKSEHSGNHWLKRWMAKKRWRRRLGTLLFGWQWKKVKRPVAREEVE